MVIVVNNDTGMEGLPCKPKTRKGCRTTLSVKWLAAKRLAPAHPLSKMGEKVHWTFFMFSTLLRSASNLFENAIELHKKLFTLLLHNGKIAQQSKPNHINLLFNHHLSSLISKKCCIFAVL